MGRSVVAITRTPERPSDEQVEEAVREAIRLAGGLDDIVPEGGTVIIKPNVAAAPIHVSGKYYDGAVTSPAVCRAIANVVRERPARPIIAESSAVSVDTEKAFKATGFLRLREEGYELLDLKGTKPVSVACPQGKIFKQMTTYEPVLKADAIISVPVMKTHEQTEASLGLKNLKGLYTDAMKKRAHRRQLFQQVADWATVVRPKMVIVDGILGQEGLGPFWGIPIEMDLIVASKDVVAADATTARIMGYEPAEVGCIKECAEHGLGVMGIDEIDVVGQSLESVRRRFLRPFEDERARIKNFTLLWGEVACTGCRNDVVSAVFGLRYTYKVEDEVEGLTVVVSNAKIPEGAQEDRLVTIGRCVPTRNRRGRYVPGCPPNTARIVEAMLGRPVKRSYASE